MAGRQTGIIADVGAWPGHRGLVASLLVAAVLGWVSASQRARAERIPTRPAAGVLRSVLTSRRAIALTFDDGPSPYTPRVLTVLHAFRARATFFEIGDQVRQYPAFSRAVVRAGDELGNHTYSHPDLVHLSDESIQLQLTETQSAIRAATGMRPDWFRPPEGAIDGRVSGVAASLGLRSVLWSVDPRDWSLPGSTAIVERVLEAARPGSIILFHDGGGYRGETVAALPIILRSLQAHGYRFLTLSELTGISVPAACDEGAAARWFSASGHRARSHHAIYRAWLQAYCGGKDYGPATSGEYALRPGTVAQDFARTAHRLEWSRRNGSIHSTLMWPWAADVFSSRGIEPLWRTPITQAWFSQYFHGHDWGPALRAPSVRHHREKQCFRFGCAVLRRGDVRWSR